MFNKLLQIFQRKRVHYFKRCIKFKGKDKATNKRKLKITRTWFFNYNKQM